MSLYKTNKKIFNIDSSNKTNGTDSNFEIEIKMPTNNPFTHVALVYGEFHKTWNMIDSNNNTFGVYEGVVPVIISVTPNRNYSDIELQEELQTQLNASALTAVYTVTYDDNTHRFKITNPTTTFKLAFDNSDPVLGKYLGIVSNVSSVLVGSINTLTASNDSIFSRYGCLVLKSNICQNYDNDELAYIYPSSYPDGNIITYVAVDPYFTACTIRSDSNSYSFSLTECHTGKAIDMDGVPWRATLVCWKD